MPTYEYECEACGKHHEAFQSMSDKPLKTCPFCKKPKLTRLIGAGAGIIFKGSGFYETDYKRSGSKDKSSGGSGDASAPAAASSTSSASSGSSSSSSSEASSGGSSKASDSKSSA